MTSSNLNPQAEAMSSAAAGLEASLPDAVPKVPASARHLPVHIAYDHRDIREVMRLVTPRMQISYPGVVRWATDFFGPEAVQKGKIGLFWDYPEAHRRAAGGVVQAAEPYGFTPYLRLGGEGEHAQCGRMRTYWMSLHRGGGRYLVVFSHCGCHVEHVLLLAEESGDGFVVVAGPREHLPHAYHGARGLHVVDLRENSLLEPVVRDN